MIKKSYLFFFLASIVCSTVFTYYYFLHTNEYPPGSAPRLADYKADKVFQTRFLITAIANFLEPTIPLLRTSLQWAVPYPINYEVILQLINIFFLASLLFLTPIFANTLGYKIPLVSPFLILVPLSWNYIIINGFIDGAGLYYPYDIPSLTFFTAGMILFLQKKWFWFYPVFILACFNRESACFISLGGFLLTLQIGNKFYLKTFIKSNISVLKQVIAQAGIWLGTRIILSYIFRDNPGEFFEEPHSMIDFLSTVWSGEVHWAMNNTRLFLTLFAGIWIVPVIFWRNLNQSAKRLCALGLIYLLALFLRSNMMETRVYNELNVIVAICAICSINPKLRSIKSA